ncbi:MAG: nucleotidyltransferase [Clostridia bacterium]|nr:nucleotidyltransferase [Clostridia bacterium]
MKNPTLVIMAAGMGSRFGGNKQVTPVDDFGHAILDYSVFDAVRAGFDKVVFIIKQSFADSFKAAFGDRIAKTVEVVYAYQEIDMLPDGFTVPEGREKPWGTAHAVLCAKDVIDGPFCVINADDFYGAGAFKTAYDFLTSEHAENVHAMVGYKVENTLTENGAVSRGVCETSADGMLTGITERTYIVATEGGAAFSEDKGETFTFIPKGTVVSMNMWCFGKSMLDEIGSRFAGFLTASLPVNPMKCEYYLPQVPNMCIEDGTASVRVLATDEKWFGMTYREDLPKVKGAIADMRAAGKYPEKLWRE